MSSLLVAKRLVCARVRLADRRILDGGLYADMQRPDGTPGRVIDRLNDPLEKYLPVAVKESHILLNKFEILTVQVARHEFVARKSEDVRELGLCLGLSDGTGLQGHIHARFLPAPRSRLLDYLNLTKERFISLLDQDHLSMVNADHIVDVTESRDRDASSR